MCTSVCVSNCFFFHPMLTCGAPFQVGDFLAREKTSQAFRDALHESYRSSKKSKHEKRRARTKAKAKDFSGKSPLSKAAFGAEHGSKYKMELYLPLSLQRREQVANSHCALFFSK